MEYSVNINQSPIRQIVVVYNLQVLNIVINYAKIQYIGQTLGLANVLRPLDTINTLPASSQLGCAEQSASCVQWLHIGQGTLHGGQTVALLSNQITVKERHVVRCDHIQSGSKQAHQ